MSNIDVENCCYYNSDNEPYCCELYDNECEAQNCYFQQLQQLKVENDNLKQEVNRHLKQQEVKDNYLIPKLKKYKQCLDEIEEICHEHKEELNYLKDEYNFALVIIQLIKQAKERE